jgi:hypothetical protein
LLLFSTDLLQFIPMWKLPTLNLIPGMVLNMSDTLLIFLFVTALPKLAARRERLLFLGPLLAIAGAVGLGFLVNIIFDRGSLDLAANRARIYFSYAFYVVVAAHLDSSRRLRRVIRFLMALGVAALGFQIAETVTGQRLASLATNYFGREIGPTVLGRRILYTWSRTDWYMLLIAMLPAGLALTTRKGAYVALAIAGLLGILLSFVRGWYNMTLLSLAVLLLFGVQGRGSTRRRLLIMIAASVLAVYAALTLIGSISEQFGSTFSLPRAILARLHSGTLEAPQATTLLGRLAVAKRLLREAARSPLVGIGPLFGGSLDLGGVSTLHALGVFGILAVIYWVGVFYYYAIRLAREGGETLSSYDRGVLIALLCSWSGMMVGYAISHDFFAARPIGIFVIMLMAGLLDRLWVSHNQRMLATKETQRDSNIRASFSVVS